MYSILSCSVMFRHVPSCSIMFRHVPSCFVVFRHVQSCSVMFRRVPSCSVMFRHVPSCSVIVRHVPSGAAPVALDIQVIQSRSTWVDPRGALDDKVRVPPSTLEREYAENGIFMILGFSKTHGIQMVFKWSSNCSYGRSMVAGRAQTI